MRQLSHMNMRGVHHSKLPSSLPEYEVLKYCVEEVLSSKPAIAITFEISSSSTCKRSTSSAALFPKLLLEAGRPAPVKSYIGPQKIRKVCAASKATIRPP